MSTWIYAAAPEHGYSASDQPAKLVLKDAVAASSEATAQQIADALNAEILSYRGKVATWQAKALLLKNAEWGGVVLLSRRVPSSTDIQEQQIVAVAITAIAALEQTSTLDMDDPLTYGSTAQMLGMLVTVGAISAASRDALLAMAEIVEPKWVPAITAEMVQIARDL